MDDQPAEPETVPATPTAGPNVTTLAGSLGSQVDPVAEFIETFDRTRLGRLDRVVDLDQDPRWLRLDRDSWRQLAIEAVTERNRAELDHETEQRRDLDYVQRLHDDLENAHGPYYAMTHAAWPNRGHGVCGVDRTANIVPPGGVPTCPACAAILDHAQCRDTDGTHTHLGDHAGIPECGATPGSPVAHPAGGFVTCPACRNRLDQVLIGQQANTIDRLTGDLDQATRERDIHAAGTLYPDLVAELAAQHAIVEAARELVAYADHEEPDPNRRAVLWAAFAQAVAAAPAPDGYRTVQR